MKKLLTLSLILVFGLPGIAQKRAVIPENLRNTAATYYAPVTESTNPTTQCLPSIKDYWPPEEETIGNTFYDLQSNSAMQRRIHLFGDGTIGATFTYGLDFPGFDDRGTGYNYFDGNDWEEFSGVRLESDRTGWPSYSPFGENGEINVAHISGGVDEGLIFMKREEKGIGEWTEWLFPGPTGSPQLAWPRITTGGINNSVVHLVTLTLPTANGGSVYQGQDGAILYSRSVDGGTTWNPENLLFEELNSTQYIAFDGDTYEIEAQGDNVAILVGEPWIDLILLKSTDGGEIWNQTLIWENPYPLWNQTPTDTFYCVDGAHSLAFDQSGMVHIAFGINRALSVDGSAQSWFPFVDGVGYWNESMPTFSNNVNALNPYGHPDSELIDNVNLIGWSQDVDGDGEVTLIGYDISNIGTYQLGLSSMSQIHIDDLNQVFIVFSSVTETYDNGNKNYRHLWCRASKDNGAFWGNFHDLSSEFIHIFDECVWPSMSISSDDNIYLVYQSDNEPGLATRFEEHLYQDNEINFMKFLKDDVIDAIKEDNLPFYNYDVTQNYPNPFNVTSMIDVNLRQTSELTLEVRNIIGQVVYAINKGKCLPGLIKLEIDATKLSSGVYFYTVKANGNNGITNKLIIE